MIYTIRQTIRWVGFVAAMWAFFFIDDAQLSQVSMGIVFLFMAGLEGGLLLREATVRADAGDFTHWMFHGEPRRDGYLEDSGIGSLIILICWTALGIGLGWPALTDVLLLSPT